MINDQQGIFQVYFDTQHNDKKFILLWFDRFSIKDSYAYPSVDREAPIISMFNSIPSTGESEWLFWIFRTPLNKKGLPK